MYSQYSRFLNTIFSLHPLVDVLPPGADSTIPVLENEDKPTVTYGDIGGLNVQKQEIKETVELQIIQLELYKAIGIHPPSGVLFYRPPGTGKTLLVKYKLDLKKINGSEFIQKYLGYGPRIVRNVSESQGRNHPRLYLLAR